MAAVTSRRTQKAYHFSLLFSSEVINARYIVGSMAYMISYVMHLLGVSQLRVPARVRVRVKRKLRLTTMLWQFLSRFFWRSTGACKGNCRLGRPSVSHLLLRLFGLVILDFQSVIMRRPWNIVFNHWLFFTLLIFWSDISDSCCTAMCSLAVWLTDAASWLPMLHQIVGCCLTENIVVLQSRT